MSTSRSYCLGATIDWDGSPYLLEGTGPNANDLDTRQITEELQMEGKALSRNLDYVAGFYYENDQVYDRGRSTLNYIMISKDLRAAILATLTS